jgi:hypothetical protein
MTGRRTRPGGGPANGHYSGIAAAMRFAPYSRIVSVLLRRFVVGPSNNWPM